MMNKMEKSIKTKKILTKISEDGCWDLFSLRNPRCVIKNAYLSAKIGKKIYNSCNQIFDTHKTQYQGQLGKGTHLSIEYQGNADDPVKFQLNLIKYDNYDFITIEGVLRNSSSEEIELAYFSPLEVLASKEGGIYVANKPEDALIYENGFTHAMEFFMRSYPANEESASQYMEFIYSKPDLKENLLIGILDLPKNISEIISNDEEDEGFLFEDRLGIAEFRVNQSFPFPKIIPSGDSLSSGVWIIMVDSETGFDALEGYADLIRKYNNICIWPNEIPHGWNSWCNPNDDYPDYFYSTGINEQIILDNMKVAIKYLKNFGLKYWQLDNGYSMGNIMTVDQIAEDRFPHGMKWLADQIRNEGIIPGIWINPFNIGVDSELFKEHEKDGWFPVPDPSFPISDSWRSLDLTIPGVQNYIRHCIRKVVKEWGYEFLKVDFTYMVMAPSKFQNRLMTASEVHRLGYQLIRDEAGPDIFIFGIGGPIGCHYGTIDGERVSLDTMPVWGKQHNFGSLESGVVTSYLTFARKYFMQNRVWINHLDCLSFRPSLKWNESLCLCTAAALFGGIFKIGDKLLALKPKDFSVYQKMLPIYRDGARPIDIFRLWLPEILHLNIEKPFGQWDIVGLFNWGENKNLLTNEVLSETTHDIVLNFQEIGLNASKSYHVFDFWEEKYMGSYSNQYKCTLDPHFSQTVSIHEVMKHPQLISSNRHITQGGVELNSVEWDKDSKCLHIEINSVTEFEHHLYVAIPNGYKFENIELNNSKQQKTTIENKILLVKYEISSNSNEITTLKINFSA
jgi:Melibiase